jgi:hypothetical protein
MGFCHVRANKQGLKLSRTFLRTLQSRGGSEGAEGTKPLGSLLSLSACTTHTHTHTHTHDPTTHYADPVSHRAVKEPGFVGEEGSGQSPILAAVLGGKCSINIKLFSHAPAIIWSLF